jgi:hypothetical protein
MKTITKIEPLKLNGSDWYYPILMCEKESDAYGVAKLYRRMSHRARVLRYYHPEVKHHHGEHKGEYVYRFIIFISMAELVL